MLAVRCKSDHLIKYLGEGIVHMNSKKSSIIGIGTVAFIVSVIGILIILGLFATFAIIFNPFVLVVSALVIVLLYFVNKREQLFEIRS